MVFSALSGGFVATKRNQNIEMNYDGNGLVCMGRKEEADAGGRITQKSKIMAFLLGCMNPKAIIHLRAYAQLGEHSGIHNPLKDYCVQMKMRGDRSEDYLDA